MTVLASVRHRVGHLWWVLLAAVLVVAELLVAQAFLLGDGTPNVLDAESTLAGAALALVVIVGVVRTQMREVRTAEGRP